MKMKGEQIEILITSYDLQKGVAYSDTLLGKVFD
jgi:hypothetical protein